MEAMQLIEIKRAETQKRVVRLRAQLDAAELDLHHLNITAETLARLNLHPTVDTTVPKGTSYAYVVSVLGDSEDDAKSPKDVYEALLANAITTISQDNVRTILSRYRDRLSVKDGRYWRKVGEETEPSTGEPADGSQTALDAQTAEEILG